MRTQRIKTLIIFSTLILGFILMKGVELTAEPNSNGTENKMTNIDSLVFLNATSPVIDGDLESFEGEWENATVYVDNIEGGKRTEVTTRVLANNTHLFMGLSYTSNVYIPVNATIPVGDEYNNESHSWYIIVFDTNFDGITGSNVAPDDAIAINYRALGGQDMFINGTSNSSFIIDTDATGENNVEAVVSSYEDDFHNYVVTIELVKELDSKDTEGNDISLGQSDTIYFELFLFHNKSAVYYYPWLFDAIMPWKLIKFDTLYESFSYIDSFSTVNALIVTTKTTNTAQNNFSSPYYFLKSYGMNTTLIRERINPFRAGPDFYFTAKSLSYLDLVILIGPQNQLTRAEIEALRIYVASGGSLYIYADATQNNNEIEGLISLFGLEIYSSKLFSKNLAENSSLELTSIDRIDLPYLSIPTPLTNHSVEDIYYTGTALNLSKTGEQIIQNQYVDIYPVYNKTGNYYLDLDEDGIFTNNETDMELDGSVTIQAAVELQRGGKIIVTSSADVINASYFNKGDFKYLFLRQAQWLLNAQYRISYEKYNVLTPQIIEGEEISVNITISGDNDTTLVDVTVRVILLELKIVYANQTLSLMEDNRSYNGSVDPSKAKANFVDVSIIMHLRGYGYNETELIEVFIEAVLEKSIQLDYIALIVFIISLGLAAVGAIAIKRFKIIE